jgi:apurinic endonuclease APN1
MNKDTVRIYNVDYEIGAHTSFSGIISNTIKESINYGMYATQFFMGNPQSFKRAIISTKDLEDSKTLISRFPMSVFSHFPYIANLAGSVQCLAWSGNRKCDDKTNAVLESITYELGILAELGGGVVIHPGSFKNRKQGIETIFKSINKIDFPKNSKLVLENSAGQGTTLATTLYEIKEIIDGVKKKEHIGVCIDTCHLMSYGEYNFKDTENIDKFFIDFENIIGMKYLSLIHLNDSETEIGSKRDRHACLLTGFWKWNTLTHFLDKCKVFKIPIILETHVCDMLTISNVPSHRNQSNLSC